ncbi:MAG: PAS domain S-box protein [Gemmatimonadota bacterium]
MTQDPAGRGGVNADDRAAALLAAIVASSDDVILSKTLEGSITSWNPAAERLYGYSAAEIAGKSASVLFPADRAGELLEMLERIRRGERVEHYETVRVRKDGGLVPVSVSVSPIFDSAGTIVGASSIARDLTAQKGAAAVLAASEERFRCDVECLLDPLFIFKPIRDAAGRITELEFRYLNEAGLALYGMSREEVIGKGQLELFPSARDAGIFDAYVQCIETGTPGRFEVPSFDENGVEGAFELAFFPGDEGIVVTARDVSAVVHAQAEVRSLNAELEQRVVARTEELERSNRDLEVANEGLGASNRELEAFSYSVSHDLRAPLRAIHGYSDILVTEHAGQLDSDGTALLGRVQANVEKMSKLIEDLLTFSRIGRQDLRVGPTAMGPLVRSVLAELEEIELDRSVATTVGVLVDAACDRDSIRQVWVNLLANAFKFTSSRPGAEVWVDSEVVGDEVVYRVRDNGVGFDMAYAGKLFGVFQRLHGVEFPGTGIGLAIVKRIVARHGGRVDASGEIDRGACFTFTLPIHPHHTTEDSHVS